MLRNVPSESFEAGLESAYAIVPSMKEAMAKRILLQLGQARGAGRLPPGRRAKPHFAQRVPITREAENRIREIIEEWPHATLRWEDLLPVLDKEFRADWQRQSLAKHPKIQRALQLKKEELRQSKLIGLRKSHTADSTTEYLNKQISALTEQNEGLKAKLRECEMRLARWRHNAYLHRVTIEQLDEPMQENDRGRSDR
jgi:hypothetical protein